MHRESTAHIMDGTQVDLSGDFHEDKGRGEVLRSVGGKEKSRSDLQEIDMYRRKLNELVVAFTVKESKLKIKNRIIDFHYLEDHNYRGVQSMKEFLVELKKKLHKWEKTREELEREDARKDFLAHFELLKEAFYHDNFKEWSRTGGEDRTPTEFGKSVDTQ